MSEATARANGRRSKIRAFIEHVFAHQKSRMGLFVRTIGIARATYQDRHGQSRLQPHPLCLARGEKCARMRPGGKSAARERRSAELH